MRPPFFDLNQKNFAGIGNKLGTVFRYHRHQIKVKC